MSIRSTIEAFVLSIDYSTKLKSVIGVSMAPVIWIALMLLKSHGGVLDSIQVQKKGLEYNRSLDFLLNQATEYHVVRESKNIKEKKEKLSSLRSEIDATIKQIRQNNSAYLDNTNSETPKIFFGLNSIERDWEKIKEGNSEHSAESLDALYFKMIEDISSLISVVSDSFQLTENIDRATHRILDILCVRIPHIQLLIPRIRALKEAKDLSPEDEGRLIIMIEQMKKDVEMIRHNSVEAYKENAILRESNWSEYHDTLQKNLLAIQTFIHLVEKGSPSEIAHKSLQDALEGTFKISSHTFAMSSELIFSQEKTLYARKMLGVGFILFGLCVVSLLYMTRFIRKPLVELKNAAEELADGNLSVRVTRQANDEVAGITDAFNKMAAFFEGVMIDANEISTRLANSATSIYTTAKQLESNVFEQEQTINQIASNAKGVSQTVQDFARSLEEVNKTAAITAHFAALGRSSLIEMESIMEQMRDASNNIVATLSALQEKVGTINYVINTIIKIADQINLLSLNTALRASKKGLKGLGFSVVAEKIRELADQTAYATLDMEKVVQNIIETVSASVKEVDKFSEQIQKQVNEALVVREELIKLITHTQEQVKAFEKVNRGMQEQSKRASQIHNSISQLTNAAQKTTQSVRNLYLEIEYIYHSTNNLQKMTKDFTKNSPRKPSGGGMIAEGEKRELDSGGLTPEISV